MAHYAFLNSNGIVEKVLTGVDEQVVQDGIGGTTEKWEEFYQSQPWNKGLICKRTSFNARINGYRKQFAGVGYKYDPSKDVFIAPQPFQSWVLDSNNDWQPPTPKPEGRYFWVEQNQQWVEVIES